MNLKEEFLDMINLLNPNITEDSYEEDYTIETDYFMEICKKTGEEITYINACSGCDCCSENCKYKLCKKVDIYLWSGSEDSRGYIFNNRDSEHLNSSCIRYISKRKQLIEEMSKLKKEFESIRDGYADHTKKIQEYKSYIKEFVDEVTKDFKVFKSVNKDIIPVVFIDNYKKDHDWNKKTFTGGDFQTSGVQSVIHIYDSWTSNVENIKRSIRHEILHYLLWCIAPNGIMYADECGVFHYFCKIYDAGAYKKMDDENEDMFKLLCEYEKEDVDDFLIKIVEKALESRKNQS